MTTALAAMVLCTSELGDHQFPHPRHATDEWGRVKIGVTMPPPTEEEQRYRFAENVFRDTLYISYAENLRGARRDAESGAGYWTRTAEHYARRNEEDPDAALYEARAEHGASVTVAGVIAMCEKKAEEQRDWLAEIEKLPIEHEDALCRLLSAEVTPDQEHYPEALARYVARWGDDSTHLTWLIGRAAVEAEMRQRTPDERTAGYERGGWSRDGRWRMGGGGTAVYVDPCSPPVDYTIIDRQRSFTQDDGLAELVEQNLHAAMKVAAIVHFHKWKDNEGPRAHWQWWLDRQLSALSQISGIDYEVVVMGDRGGLPDRETVRRWELEINALDSEDQAQLRHWEAVRAFWELDLEESTEEDIEWASYVEEQAEEEREWALEKRRRVERSRPSNRRERRGVFSPLARRLRLGAHRRESRGGSSPCRGSRRAKSPSSSTGPPGDDDPPGRAKGDCDPGRAGETNNERPEGALHGLLEVAS